MLVSPRQTSIYVTSSDPCFARGIHDFEYDTEFSIYRLSLLISCSSLESLHTPVLEDFWYLLLELSVDIDDYDYDQRNISHLVGLV